MNRVRPVSDAPVQGARLLRVVMLAHAGSYLGNLRDYSERVSFAAIPDSVLFGNADEALLPRASE